MKDAPTAADSRPVESEIFRSRAGDFVFAGATGVIVLLGAVMLSDLHAGAAAALAIIYGSGLFLRYFSLREAAPVAPGITFNEEQVQKFERLRAVLNALPQPVMLLDENDHIEMSNPVCATTFGKEVSGRHISAVIRAPAALDSIRTARHERTVQEAELSMLNPDERTMLFYAAPVSAGQLADRGRIIVMLRDRTAQKKLERMRTDFIANASHELRTPLASMMGFIETMQNHAKDDPEARQRFLRIMQSQAERMLRLVQDLISLSAIELNEAKTPSDRVDLNETALSVCDMLAPIAQARGGTLVCEACADPVPVTADRDQVIQVIQNLCDNALKYGGTGPQVTVTTGHGIPPVEEGFRRTGDTAEAIAVRLGVDIRDVAWVRVQDRGEGIERTDLPRLTERFYRIDGEKSRSVGGTGLGLAIVKHILQRHRGGIAIESARGEGSAFTCFFPPAGR